MQTYASNVCIEKKPQTFIKSKSLIHELLTKKDYSSDNDTCLVS